MIGIQYTYLIKDGILLLLNALVCRGDQEGAIGYDNQFGELGCVNEISDTTPKPFINRLNDFPSLSNEQQAPRPTSSVTFTSKITPSAKFDEQNFPALSMSTLQFF